MPLEIDPAWEYFVADPEIQWIFDIAGSGVNKIEMLGHEERGSPRHYPKKEMGFRFGKGDPNKCQPFRLKRAKPEREIITINPKRCPVCKKVFFPSRDTRMFDTKSCARIYDWANGRVDERLILPTEAKCEECGETFKPMYPGNILCSKQCVIKRMTKGNVRSPAFCQKFKEMWESGASRAEIAAELDVTPTHVRKIRKEIGLLPRPSGNHSRKKQESKSLTQEK